MRTALDHWTEEIQIRFLHCLQLVLLSPFIKLFQIANSVCQRCISTGCVGASASQLL